MRDSEIALLQCCTVGAVMFLDVGILFDGRRIIRVNH